jgi:hypothetical protein
MKNLKKGYVCRSTEQLSYSYNRSQQDALFLNFILVNNSTCFGQTYCPSSRALILYSQLIFVTLVTLTAVEVASRQSK